MAVTIASWCARGTSSPRPRRSLISTCGTGSIARRWSICSTGAPPSSIRACRAARFVASATSAGCAIWRSAWAMRCAPIRRALAAMHERRLSTPCAGVWTIRRRSYASTSNGRLKPRKQAAYSSGVPAWQRAAPLLNQVGWVSKSGRHIMFNAVIDAPFGKIGIRLQAETVREIVYLPESVRNVAPETPLAKQVAQQIERYFERASASFDLPLATVGTAFQKRVWAVISEIPPGVVLTYGQLARQVASAPRA